MCCTFGDFPTLPSIPPNAPFEFQHAILSRLQPLREKFRAELVSRRWRRLMHEKVWPREYTRLTTSDIIAQGDGPAPSLNTAVGEAHRLEAGWRALLKRCG